jgi:hypothetical protein
VLFACDPAAFAQQPAGERPALVRKRFCSSSIGTPVRVNPWPGSAYRARVPDTSDFPSGGCTRKAEDPQLSGLPPSLLLPPRVPFGRPWDGPRRYGSKRLLDRRSLPLCRRAADGGDRPLHPTEPGQSRQLQSGPLPRSRRARRCLPQTRPQKRPIMWRGLASSWNWTAFRLFSATASWTGARPLALHAYPRPRRGVARADSSAASSHQRGGCPERPVGIAVSVVDFVLGEFLAGSRWSSGLSWPHGVCPVGTRWVLRGHAASPRLEDKLLKSFPEPPHVDKPPRERTDCPFWCR